MNTETAINDKENLPYGCLKLNNKNYPVFKGHNTIGRNPGAIINIKNVNVSKHHAIITIMDTNTHYISDIRSSNGTLVDNTKLDPLKLYLLQNGAPIKFGDVFCTYTKFETEKKIENNLDETQDFSQSFYGSNTQQVGSDNLPDGVNFNELPTQIFEPRTISINEMPTQIHSFEGLDEGSDASCSSIDFMTMQKAVESQSFSKEETPSNSLQITLFATNSQKTDDEPSISQICPIENSRRNVIQSDSDSSVAINSQQVIKSDNESVISQICPIKKSTGNVIQSDSDSSVVINSQEVIKPDDEPPLSQICPIKKSRGNVIQSDSESDTEEYVPNMSKSKYVISDDSETDIEDEVSTSRLVDVSGESGEDKDKNQETSINQSSAMDSLRLVDESVDGSEKKIQETSINGDREKNQETSINQSSAMDSLRLVDESEKKIQETSVNEDHMYYTSVVSTSSQGTSSSGCKNLSQNNNIILKDSEATINNVGDLKEISGEKENHNEENTQDIFDQPTQKYSVQDSGNSNGNPNEEKESHIEDIFDLPTQKCSKDKDNEEGLSEEKESHKEDNIFDQPTQICGESNYDVEIQNKKTCSQKNEILKENTQDLDFAEKKSVDKTVDINDQETEELDQEINNTTKDDFLPNTETLELVESLEDVVSLPPTQALEFLHRDERNEVAQDVFAVPDPLPSKEKEDTQDLENLLSDSPKKQNKTLDDSFILPPTQAMEALHEDGTKFNQVEDELAEIFASQSMMATQQLVSVLDMSHDEIIDDSICEGTRRSLPSFNLPKPISEDAVKDILSDGIDKETQEFKILDKEKGKDDVKTYSKKKNQQVEESKTASGSDRSTQGSSSNETRKNRRKQKLVLLDSQSVVIDDGERKEEENEKNVGNTRSDSTRGGRKKAETEALSHKSDDSEMTETKRSGKQRMTTDNTEEENNIVLSKDQSSSVNVETKRRGRAKNKTNKSEEENILVDLTKETNSQERKEKSNVLTLRKEENENKDASSKDEVEMNVETKKKGIQIKNDETTSISVDNNTTTRSRRNKAESSKEIEVKSLSRTTSVESKTSSQDSIALTRSGRKKAEVFKKVENVISLSSTSTTSGESQTSSQDSIASTRSSRKKAEASKEVEVKDPSRTTIHESKTNSKNTTVSTRSGQKKGETSKDLKEEVKGPSSTNNDESKTHIRDVTASTRAGRKKAEISKDLEQVKSESKSSNDQPKTQTRSKRKNEETLTTSEVPNKLKKKVLSSSEESIVSIDKNHELEAKPSTSTPRKRALRHTSTNSEDAFENKVPKIDLSVIKKPTMNTRKAKNENVEVASTSTSSSQDQDEEPTKRGRRLSANSRRLKKEQENKSKQNETADTSQGSPSRSRRQTKPKVVFTMMDSPELESLIRQLGGSVVDTVDACTVLVTESVKRSQKLLCAVGQSKPICSPKWLQACKKSFAFVDPWDYILEDKEAEKKWNFSLRESLNRSSKNKLLENYTFQLIVNNAADVLKGAIESCGGKCVRNLSKAETDNLVIVSSQNNKSKYSRLVKQNPSIKVVEAEAIFDGTLRQEFRFKDYLIT